MWRLPDVKHVRWLVQQVFVSNDRNDPLTLWDLIADMLIQLGDLYDYKHLQTNTAMVVDAVTSTTLSGYDQHYVVTELTPELVAALHKAILPRFCRKVLL